MSHQVRVSLEAIAGRDRMSRRVGTRGRKLQVSFFAAALMLATMVAPGVAGGDERPLNLSATLWKGTVTLTWDAPTTNAGTVTGYQVLRRAPAVDAEGVFHPVDDVGLTPRRYVDADVTAGTQYVYRVKAYRGTVLSNWSGYVNLHVPASPAAPGGLAATEGVDVVDLEWTDPGDDTIDGYEVRYAESDAALPSWGGEHEVAGSDSSTTRHRVEGLTGGVEYRFEVRAYNEGGVGASSEVTATPVGVPAAPAGLAAVSGDGQAALSWADAGDATIDGYQLRYSGTDVLQEAWSDIANSGAATTGHTVEGLTNGESYVFEVRAFNEVGAGDSSRATATPGPLARPGNLTASIEGGAVVLTWDAPASNGGAVTGYQVLRRQPSQDAVGVFTPVADALPGAGSPVPPTTYTDAGVEGGRQYVYRVKAVYGPFLSNWSNYASLTLPLDRPVAPEGLTATPGDRNVLLAWDDPDDNSLTGYQVRHTNDPPNQPQTWEDFAVATEHMVEMLTNGTAYTFELRAKRGAVAGDSSVVTATPVPGAPTGFTAMPGDSMVALSWDDPGTGAVDGYELRFAPGGPSTTPPVFDDAMWVSLGFGTEATASGLNNWIEYTFELRGVAGAVRGNSSVVSETPIPPPGMPDSLNAASGNGQVVLSWLDPGNGTITGYQVRYEESGTVLPEWSDNHDIVSSAATTMHTVPNLTNGTEYTFEVRAKNKAGPGSAASVTAEAGSRAPTNLAWALDDAGNVVLTWDPPSIDAASVTRYEIHNTDALGSGTIHPDGTTTRYVDESVPLEEYTHYTYRVRALRGAQPSAWSNTISVEVPRLGPDAPDSLTAAAGVGQVLLTWKASPDAAVTGYQARHGSDPASLPHWVELAGSGRTTTMHTVQNLTNGTEYTFEVRAKAGELPGDSSRVTATPVPAKPANFRATAGNTKVTLTWNRTTDAAVTGYEYHYFSGARPAEVAWMDTTVISSHAVTGLTNNTTYTFEVRAKAGTVHGDSATATATPRAQTVTPPPCPALSIDAISNVTVNVNQSFSRTARATGGCAPITIEMSGAPSGVTMPSGTGRTKTISSNGVSSTGTSTVTVTATDARGTTASTIFTITVVTPPPPCSAPGAVTGLSGTGQDGQVDLSWTNPGGTLTANQVRYAKTGSTMPNTWTDIAVKTTHPVGGLDVCQEYTFQVRAKNDNCPAASIGAYDDATATTTGSAPGAVTNVEAKTGVTWLKWSWTNPSGAIDGNQYIFWEDGESQPDNWTDIGVTTTHTSNGLTPNTTYHIKVRAWNNCGAGESASGTKTIPPVIDELTITCPDDITVRAGGEMPKGVTATATGGTEPRTFSKASGPSWVTVSSSGGITGTAPSTPGNYTATVTVTDDNEESDSCPFDITVVEGPTISCPADQTVKAGGSISATATATGGATPYDWSISTSSGLSLSISSSGVIIGTAPSTPGNYTATVTVTDDNEESDSCPFDITVVEGPTISCPADQTVKTGGSISATATAKGGAMPYGWSISTSSGLSLSISSSGVITGTAPSTQGDYTATVTMTDANGLSDSCPFDIAVVEGPDITCPADQTVKTGGSISATATATGGTAPYTFSKSRGPSWVTVLTDGNINGTAPSSAGTYTVKVTVTDANQCTDSCSFTITVEPCPPVSVASIADRCVTTGGSLSLTASASGGCGTTAFSKESGSLWISVSSGGSISGTAPSTSGTHPVTVTAEDSDDESNTDDESFTVYVVPPLTIAAISDAVVTWHLDMTPIQVSVSGGRSSYSYSLESAPVGISISSSGEISGTPTQLGSATVTVIVRDRCGYQAEEAFDMTVARPGDFNGDGRRDAADAKLFNKKMGLRRSDTGYDRRMDLNGDGIINYADFVILTGYIESDATARGGGGKGNSGTSGD